MSFCHLVECVSTRAPGAWRRVAHRRLEQDIILYLSCSRDRATPPRGTDMKFLALIFAGLVGTTVTGFAQTAAGAIWPPMPGSRARISSPAFGGERQVGTIESVTGDTLQFRAQGVSSVSLTPSQITRIDVSTGRHTSKAKWGAIGFLVGAGAGAAIGSATY